MSDCKRTIKLICLNAWGGIVKDELRDFILEQADTTDIFCFQEVSDNVTHMRIAELGNVDKDLFKTISSLLASHKGYYAPHQENDEGLAIFVKSDIHINEINDVFVHRYFNALEDEDRATLGRNIQSIQFTENERDYTVINFHGLWNGAGKTDSDDRIKQSLRIREFIETKAKGKIVLAGDFNLDPDTRSMSILEKDMRNLVKEYGITTTRSAYHKWPSKFADYVVVSDDLNVIRFEVLKDEVSDHLPLLIEFC